VKSLLRKLILGLVAAAMMAVSAAVLVVGAAFALYDLLKEYIGAAGAAGVVALGAACVMAGAALFLERGVLRAPAKQKPSESDQTMVTKLIVMAQQRPIVATGALIGVAAMAIRNPALISIAIKAFLDPKSKPTGKKA
jgi:hypothetical protein